MRAHRDIGLAASGAQNHPNLRKQTVAREWLLDQCDVGFASTVSGDQIAGVAGHQQDSQTRSQLPEPHRQINAAHYGHEHISEKQVYDFGRVLYDADSSFSICLLPGPCIPCSPVELR